MVLAGLGGRIQVDGAGPLFAHVRKRLECRISKADAGEKLPSERQLAGHFGVDRITVRRAMVDLEREGYVIRHQGRGTFVKKVSCVGRVDVSSAGTIGVVIPDVEMPENKRFLAAIEKEAKVLGYSIKVCNCELDTKEELIMVFRGV